MTFCHKTKPVITSRNTACDNNTNSTYSAVTLNYKSVVAVSFNISHHAFFFFFMLRKLFLVYLNLPFLTSCCCKKKQEEKRLEAAPASLARKEKILCLIPFWCPQRSFLNYIREFFSLVLHRSYNISREHISIIMRMPFSWQTSYHKTLPWVFQ